MSLRSIYLSFGGLGSPFDPSAIRSGERQSTSSFDLYEGFYCCSCDVQVSRAHYSTLQHRSTRIYHKNDNHNAQLAASVSRCLPL